MNIESPEGCLVKCYLVAIGALNASMNFKYLPCNLFFLNII
ncbi:MAG: hypothetical protein BWX72_00322 [Firmicutes bacterium ADurb.Bin080]|nr:MAG: hypothetical protein BWX72_00322 [Firmicutes bacterium ADurb.Bin080]